MKKLINLIIAGTLLAGCAQSPDPADDPRTYVPEIDAEFPIIAWTGVEADKSLSKFPVMKAGGINTYLGWYPDRETMLKALDDAEATGVKMITSCPELRSQATAAEVARSMMNHPALMAYHLKDEPEVWDLDSLGEIVKIIQAVDSVHPSYINLYPNWAWNKDKYAGHVQMYLDRVPTPFISFDNYPVVSIDGAPNALRPDWYRNLEEISEASRRSGRPFWAFALALSHRLDDHHFYNIPTLAQLRLMVFSDLVYGAQALQYFTYYGFQYPEDTTPVYDLGKMVNSEVQALAPIFLGAEVKSVAHTGAELPEGTRPLTELPDCISSLSTGDGSAVVSHLENHGNGYLAIVNKDFRKPMALDIKADSRVRRIFKDGSVAAADNATVTVEPGDMVIYAWRK